jgi:hypothetical protein
MVKPGRSYGASDAESLGSIVVIGFTRPVDTTHVPLARSDSKMGYEHDEAAHGDVEHWQCSVGQHRRCKERTCA